MIILPDGTIKLSKNFKGKPTGETVVITRDQLPQYGLSDIDYQAAFDAQKIVESGLTTSEYKAKNAPPTDDEQSQSLMARDIANKGTLSDITKQYSSKGVPQYDILSQYNTTSPWGPAQETGEQLAGKGFGYDPDVIEKFRPGYKEQVKKTEQAKIVNPQADKLVTELENYYFQNELSMGNLGGIFADIGTKLDPNSSYAVYKNMLESRRPQLAKLAGDVGNIAVVEQIQAGKPFPTARSTKKNAIERFQQIRKVFGLPERDYGDLSKYSTVGLQDISKQFGGK